MLKIIAAKKPLLLLITSCLLFYGNATVYVDANADSRAKLNPIATVTLNDPPPPWEARSNLHSAPVAETTSTNISAPVSNTSYDASATLTLEDMSAEDAIAKVALPSGGIAAWYRNRQHSRVDDNHFVSLEQQAKEGDINAQYQLGLLYYSGSIQRPKDSDRAIQWLSRAAEQGNSDAQYSLGVLYSNNRAVIEHQALAQKWLQASAKQGHGAAKMALIDYANLANGQQETAATLVASSSNRLTPAKQQAKQQEQPQEEIRVANITAPPRTERRRISRPSRINANQQAFNLSHLKQDAYAGDRRSQLLLGSLYEDGKQGVHKNLPKAAKWYRKAATQGYPQAQYNLGLLYEGGKGMMQNYHQATKWYKRAAEKGLSEAQNNLAVLYILGKGVAKDKKRAETLFRNAAKQGNHNAIRNLNLLLEKN